MGMIVCKVTTDLRLQCDESRFTRVPLNFPAVVVFEGFFSLREIACSLEEEFRSVVGAESWQGILIPLVESRAARFHRTVIRLNKRGARVLNIYRIANSPRESFKPQKTQCFGITSA